MIRRILEDEPGSLVLPAPVAAEVDYLVRKRAGPVAERYFLEDLAEGRFDVQGLTRDEHRLALSFHDRYEALNLGLADLSVVVLAYRYQTNRLLTFDERDFRAVQPLHGGSFLLIPTDL